MGNKSRKVKKGQKWAQKRDLAAAQQPPSRTPGWGGMRTKRIGTPQRLAWDSSNQGTRGTSARKVEVARELAAKKEA